jgi:hypothetical protein
MAQDTSAHARRGAGVRAAAVKTCAGGEQALGQQQRREISRDAVREMSGRRTPSEIRTNAGQRDEAQGLAGRTDRL